MTGAGTTWCCLGENAGTCREYTPGCTKCLSALCLNLHRSGDRVTGEGTAEGEASILRMQWGVLQGFLLYRASLEEWVYYGDVVGH